jgi:hypothetical protein
MSSSAFVYVGLNACLDLTLNKGLTFALLPAILMAWSPADVDTGIQGSLIQIYPVLLSALASVSRQQLSIYDANYALSLSMSPPAVYLMTSSIFNLFGIKTDLYEQIDSYRWVVRALGALAPLFWFGLNFTIGFSTRAFKDSELCRNSTFKDWILDFLYFWFWFLWTPGSVYWWIACTIFAMFPLCLFRRRIQVMEEFRARRKGALTPWGRWCMPWTLVRCAWYVSIVVGA